MYDQPRSSNFYQLTSQVLNDKSLSHAEKICMAILYGLSDEHGRCYPSNEWLMDKLDLKERQVRDVLANLENNNYILREVISCENNPFKKYRIIHVTNNFKLSLPGAENCRIGGAENRRDEGRKTAGIIDKKDIINKKEKKRGAAPPKKEPSAPPSAVFLNHEEKKFGGLSEEDINLWQATYPSINVRKELQKAYIWALDKGKKNYRKSLNAWMSNADRSNTTPFKGPSAPSDAQEIPTDEEVKNNKAQGDQWEKDYEGKKNLSYQVDSSLMKVTFILPNNETYCVSYSLKTQEFLKQCQKAIQRMKLTTSLKMK